MNKTLKSIFISLGVLLLIVALLAGIKFGQIMAMVQAGENQPQPTETVSTYTAEVQKWPNTYTAVGTVEASEGIVITAQVAGKVASIAFKSGDPVKKGTVLLVQESENERAQLSAAEARLRLAKANYERLVPLRKNNTISQSALDEAQQQMESAQGDVDDLKATLEKKIVRAPFDGRLGIRKADLGQDLQVGGEIVSLQATNTVRVNFPVPQFWLVQMSRGLPVQVSVGDGSDAKVEGEITAIGAEINTLTRNAIVQSYLNNDKGLLIPGMAVEVQVTLSNPQEILAVPSTAVIYAPFGDTLFVIEPGEKEGSHRARQQFVRLGKSRGDFIEIVDGLKAGEVVASAGAFRLLNGQAVILSSQPSPEYQLEPNPSDS
ncbi:efflux RND transporter periplasmic adaptor subunit [Cellvibrio japonicus]|uniref:Efflux transporter, RND family, MFP subunit n=1 Tax=Cellvibrio japonicus (strain Ueda107) TaxID=498211 RepID=B3PKL5_CELJU|nr:efflux RND transporter periplasmic adaptor subunit [Cellvibrio japonicus]ACE83864.1 efflux transporter, RND family, MFP subunit [Cellvibrio japonicus Ueda107]QEI12873.1 efflux RND transporter periplasmic adaptor subunit [Cellvibrio japonicus]QEI16447.1 efflux RND transporter periplasmic adaptor subunit [Cellvibrio japonicus]QEI20025.1 efflux RND transporter periplasmic adaptor subunit [Cellvibrio japonicus]